MGRQQEAAPALRPLTAAPLAASSDPSSDVTRATSTGRKQQGEAGGQAHRAADRAAAGRRSVQHLP